MEIQELQKIYAAHPGVKALCNLTDDDCKGGVILAGLTTGSAAAAGVAG